MASLALSRESAGEREEGISVTRFRDPVCTNLSRTSGRSLRLHRNLAAVEPQSLEGLLIVSGYVPRALDVEQGGLRESERLAQCLHGMAHWPESRQNQIQAEVAKW